MKMYAGMDVHSKETEYVVCDEEGREIAGGRIETTTEGMAQWVKANKVPKGTEVAMESGNVTVFVARQLEKLGLVPRVFDAHEVRRKAHRPTQKTDRRDAIELCHGLRQGLYRSRVLIPTEEQAVLREVVSRRRHFVRLAAGQMSAVKRLLRSAGRSRMYIRLKKEEGWEACIAALGDNAMLQCHVKQHHAVWRMAQKQVEACDEMLVTKADVYEKDIARLQTIPGVGPIVATTALSVIGDIKRFPTAKDLASHVGIVPSSYSSGERERTGHITKRGSAELRAMLCEAAHHASRPSHPLHPYFAKLCAKGGYKIAVVAIAHRLLRIIFGMLKSQTDFDVRRLGIEAGPFVTKKVKLYRLKPIKKAA